MERKYRGRRRNRKPKQVWLIEGKLCLSKHFVEQRAQLFDSTMGAFGPSTAIRFAFQWLKKYVADEKDAKKSKKCALREVYLTHGKYRFEVKGMYCNNNLFYAKHASQVFQAVSLNGA